MELNYNNNRDKNDQITNYYIKGIKSLKNDGVKKTLKKILQHFFPSFRETYIFTYQDWIIQNEKDIYETISLDYRPLISIVVPVYNVESEILKECIRSVQSQSYTNWELLLVDDASTLKSVRETLKEFEDEKNIHIQYREKNGGISETSNDGIKAAEGEFIAFMDCDDTLAPNAIFEVTKLLNEHPEYEFIYSDQDLLSEDGKLRHGPFFKPDWSPDTFLSIMYTYHLGVYKTEIVKKTGLLCSDFNGAQDYDFTLRFVENTSDSRIGHIPKVLYHWREISGSAASDPDAKPYAIKAQQYAKEAALLRRNIAAWTEYLPNIHQYRICYEPPENSLISIVIPSKEKIELLEQCIQSIFDHKNLSGFEIIIVDNGSSEKTREEIESFIEGKPVRYFFEPMEFNFSQMCNIGAKYAKGDFLLFLNNDIKAIKDNWLDRMAGQAYQAHVGAVGAKLYYPDSNIIQHIGVINHKIGPCHYYIGMPDDKDYYFCRNNIEYDLIAVTGACLMIEKKKFLQIGEFDESFPIAYNDVDLCFRLYEAGYYNVIRSDAVLYHFESASRGLDEIDETKKERLANERERLYQKHPNLQARDPFYSPNLKTDCVTCELNG
ncbi:MAG: glycosyltransferase family 2 protein [Anaerolineaceae bacterium]|nr:glycosyltransferase family 2 protein [Anaerolineaceae bacterium]